MSDDNGNGTNGKPPRFERHWQTARLVEAFAAMEIGEKISRQALAENCGISIESISKRVQSAKQAALHEHHVIIQTIRGWGFERLSQDAADIPAASYLGGARRKARRARDVIKHGVTDWESIERSKKNELFAIEAQAAAVAGVTAQKAHKQLVGAVANGRLDFGRTLELLKK